MIHASLSFPMHSIFHVSPLYVFPFSLQLTWLADPALVTLVYPNWMQYTPRVLQEASLLDGVDAGVRGNGRRFSKTSSYPPCHHYAFNHLYHYFLTTHFTPLHIINHSHTRYRLCSPIVYQFTTIGNVSYLWQNNVVKDSSWPLSYLV